MDNKLIIISSLNKFKPKIKIKIFKIKNKHFNNPTIIITSVTQFPLATTIIIPI
jgi:hypothetical protein